MNKVQSLMTTKTEQDILNVADLPPTESDKQYEMTNKSNPDQDLPRFGGDDAENKMDDVLKPGDELYTIEKFFGEDFATK